MKKTISELTQGIKFELALARIDADALAVDIARAIENVKVFADKSKLARALHAHYSQLLHDANLQGTVARNNELKRLAMLLTLTNVGDLS